jgi:excisionase family DNA binding protein
MVTTTVVTATELERIYTPEELAEHFAVGDETIRHWLRTGQLRGFKAGRQRWRVRASDVEVFIRAGGAEQ